MISRLTIGRKLTIFGVLMVLIPSVIIGGYAVYKSSEGFEDFASEQITARAQEIALAIDYSIDGEMKVVVDLAAGNAPVEALKAIYSKGLSESNSEIESLNKRLERVMKSEEISEGTQVMVITDRKGVVIAATDKQKYTGVNISDRDYFSESIKGNYFVGQINKNKVTGEFFVPVAAPIKDDNGNVLGMVANIRDLDFLKKIIDKAKIGKSGYSFIIDSRGMVIAHPITEKILNENMKDTPEMVTLANRMISKDFGMEKYEYKGVVKYAGFAPIKWAGWSIGLNIPEDEVLETALNVRNNTIIFISIFILIAVLISYIFSYGIKKIINGMKDEIGRVIEGGVKGRLNRRGNLDLVNFEFRGIIEGINVLLDSIASHFDSIPLPVTIVDKDYKIQYINETGLNLLNEKFDTVKGKKCYDFFRTHDCNNENCAVKRAMKSGNSANGKTEANLAGKKIMADYSANVVKDLDGNIVGGIEIFVDKTDEKKAALREQKISKFQKNEIDKINMILQKMSEGDLTMRYIVDDGDTETKSIKELFDFISSNFNFTLNSLNEVLYNVSNSINQIENAASQVSGASQSLSSGTTEQAASLEEISSSLQNVASQSEHNAENAKIAVGISDNSKKDAEDGDNRMKKMSDAMLEINKSSNDISRIIKTIDEIAFQTNLLALNAAVEAARAGKHGKGFAVVAEEVRSLAARSAKAAKETSEMIEESINKVQNGTELVHHTTDSLKKIVSSAGKVASFINEINDSSGAQYSSISQVNIALDQVSNVTQQNAANAEETAAAADQLSSQAQELKIMIEKFKLDEIKQNIRLLN
ncbi:MAG: Cache 3/Cache 2 fusion domain-containing protein [Candidatus Delongbacteria bacterium]|nr:Cache 3/Cache 2 fusion domain-containing protein [Candidatus Delongbacteria bacterium]MBN2836555.1 Cache 3/Cache 2 fusion domain-containing protein [Candidatus Delongbacteria bacterium]